MNEMIDYPFAKFGDFSFSRFGFIVRTDRQTDRITDADDRCTHATTVGVCNNIVRRAIATQTAERRSLELRCC